MNKLTLDLNALTVQSFATDDAAVALFGTVHGRQGKPTGQQDTDCSAVDACPSARGCSEIAECRPTESPDCPDTGPDCPTFTRGCTVVGDCHETRNPHHCASAVDACPSARGCTEVNCPAAQ